MIQKQTSIPLSTYSELYDIIVPRDNKLRKIKDNIDFTFVYDALVDKYCQNNGRMAEDPVRMFKYLFLKITYNMSDRDLVERVRTDLSFKLFLDMLPEEQPIDASLLSFFRRKRLQDMDLVNILIQKSISMAIEKNVIKRRNDIIIDSTHTASRFIPYNPRDLLKERSKELRKQIYDADENLAGKIERDHQIKELHDEMDYCRNLLEYVDENLEDHKMKPSFSQAYNNLEETVGDVEEKYTVSKQDHDAKAGSKGKGQDFFGYKTHSAIVQEGLVVAATITSGEVGDTTQGIKLIDQAKVNGIDVECAIGDSAYSSKEILAKGQQENITIISKLHPSVFTGYRNNTDDFKFTINKDADCAICPNGNMSIYKSEKRYKDGNRAMQYSFDLKKCKICPYKSKCLKHEGVKSKSISIAIHTKEQEKQMEYQGTDAFKEKYKTRYKVERTFAHLKQHGYGKSFSYGLDAMNIQAAVSIFVLNTRIIMNHLEKKGINNEPME